MGVSVLLVTLFYTFKYLVMKKHLIFCWRVLIIGLTAIFLLPISCVRESIQPESVIGAKMAVLQPGGVLEVTPTTHDFGDVVLGTPVHLIVTVTNVGDDAISITSISLTGSNDFLRTDGVSVPVLLLPLGWGNPGDEFRNLEIQFNPTVLGAQQAQLTISDDDPSSADLIVPMMGTGVHDTPPPVLDIEDLIVEFDEGVTYGTLSVKNDAQLAVMRNALWKANEAYVSGNLSIVCNRLQWFYDRISTTTGPHIVLFGPAAESLKANVSKVMANLGC
jgi:hypothetical protein